MEELIQKIDELVKVLKKNAMPVWASIILAIVPIAISVVVLIMTLRQNKQNKKLQEEISNKNAELQITISKRECAVQMHNDFLKIYEGFCSAQHALNRVGRHVVDTFYNPSDALSWLNSYIEDFNVLIKSYDMAVLLLPKDENNFRDILENILNEHRSIVKQIKNYLDSNEYLTSIENAWNIINSNYNIKKHEYLALVTNRQAYKDFIKLSITETLTEINEHKKRIRDLYTYEKFDVFFAPYVRIEY